MNRSMSSVIKDDHSYHRPTTPFPRFRFFGFVHDGLLRSQWSFGENIPFVTTIISFIICAKKESEVFEVVKLFGDPIFRLVGTFSTHTSQPIESSTGVHPVKFLGISPLNLDDRKSIRAARWYVRGYFFGKKRSRPSGEEIQTRNNKLVHT